MPECGLESGECFGGRLQHGLEPRFGHPAGILTKMGYQVGDFLLQVGGVNRGVGR